MSYLKRIIHNCKKATLLIDKKESGRLTLRETFELKIHLIGCSFCRLYGKQSRAINEMVRQLFRSAVGQGSHLDDDFKRVLQERIDEQLDKN